MEQAAEQAVEQAPEKEAVDHYVIYVFHEGQWHVWDEGDDLLVVVASLEHLVDEYICECKLVQITPDGEEIEVMARKDAQLAGASSQAETAAAEEGEPAPETGAGEVATEGQPA